MNTPTPHTEGDEFDKFNHIADGRILATPAELLAWRDKAVAEAEYRGMLRVDKAVIQALNDYMRRFGGSPDPDLCEIYAQLEGNMQRHRRSLAALTQPEEKR